MCASDSQTYGLSGTYRISYFTGIKVSKLQLPLWIFFRLLSRGLLGSVVLKTDNVFLISNFRRVLNAVCFLLGYSLASECYMPTFRNTLFHLHRQVGVKNELGLRNVEVFIWGKALARK